MDRLTGKVVVITGASSGLGREASLQLARRGCRLVVAARGQEGLDVTAAACHEVGGDVLTVVADVTDEAQVQTLAETALWRYGRIDVWVNNAGVTLFAPLTQGPFELH